MVLGSKYKARKKLESDKEAMDSQAFARCRLQLGQLRSKDPSVVRTLEQVRPACHGFHSFYHRIRPVPSAA